MSARDEHPDYELPVSPAQQVANAVAYRLAPGSPPPVVVYEDAGSAFYCVSDSAAVDDEFENELLRAVCGIGRAERLRRSAR